MIENKKATFSTHPLLKQAMNIVMNRNIFSIKQPLEEEEIAINKEPLYVSGRVLTTTKLTFLCLTPSIGSLWITSVLSQAATTLLSLYTPASCYQRTDLCHHGDGCTPLHDPVKRHHHGGTTTTLSPHLPVLPLLSLISDSQFHFLIA